MMHLLTARSARSVERFELTTRNGRTYRYPQPTWLDRLAAWLHSVAEPAVLSAVVVGLLYFAGELAEAIEALASDSCRNANRNSYKPAL